MKRHPFMPDPHADPQQSPENVDLCDICGQEPDAAIHEMDGVPPDEPDFPDDIREPGTVGALFDAAGLRNPPGT